MAILGKNTTKSPFNTIYVGDSTYENIGYVEIEQIFPEWNNLYGTKPYIQFEFSHGLIENRKRVRGKCDSIRFDEENKTLYLHTEE